MIKVENLCKSFRTEDVETIALNNVSFTVEDGEFVAIMGPVSYTHLRFTSRLSDDDDFKRDELIRKIEHSVEQMKLSELEALS